MKSKNLIINLSKYVAKEKISLDKAIKDLISITISEEDIKETLSIAEDLMEKDPPCSLIYARLAFESSNLIKKMTGESHFILASAYQENYFFEEAIELYDRATEIFINDNQVIELASCYLNKATIYSDIEQYQEALSLYREARQIFIEHNKPVDVATCDVNIGTIYCEIKEFEYAMKLYEQAREIFKANNKPIESAKCTDNIANIYVELQKYNEAMILYEQVRQVYIENEMILNIALCDLHIADIHRNLEKFHKAIELYDSARNIFKKFKQWTDVALCNLNKGNTYLDMQNPHKAIELYDSARNIFKKFKQWSRVAKCNSNKATAYYELQRFDKALILYEEAIRELRKTEQWIEVAGCNLNKADTYRYLHQFDKALKHYTKAKRIFKKYNLPIDIASCDLGRANTYLDLEQFNTAIKYYGKARKIFKDYGKQIAIALCDFNKGHAYSELKKFNNALSLYDSAIKIFKNNGQPVELAYSYLAKANTYFELKQFDKAMSYYNKALNTAPDLLPDLEWHCLDGLGEIYIGENIEKAIIYFKEAIEIIENKSLNDISYLDIKTSLRRKSLFVYEELVKCLLITGKYKEALEYLERTKARNLATIMSGENLSSGVPEKIKEKEHKFNLKLSSIQFILSKEIDSTRRKKLSLKFERIKKEYINFIRMINMKYDPFYNPFYQEKTIKYNEIQNLIKDKHTALVEFFLSSEKPCAFIIKKEGDPEVIFLKCSIKDIYDNIITYINSYADYLEVIGTVTARKWLTEMNNILEFFYTELFTSLEYTLTDITKIIFIPHKILFLIPLHAIYKQVNGKKTYIIEDYEISYSPSARILKMCHDKNRPEKEKLFAFLCDTKGNLKYSGEEIKSIKELFIEKKIIEGTCYEDIIKHASSANFLHFICHGRFSLEKNLMEAGLSVFNKKGKKVTFTLRDIFSKLSLQKACMVVLSACETCIVEPEETDEFAGLPAGLLFAGSPAVIGSLWTVPDEATYKLMKKFYENILIKNLNNASALRQAQMDIMKEKNSTSQNTSRLTHIKKEKIHFKDSDWSHPYYWAGFCCYGAD